MVLNSERFDALYRFDRDYRLVNLVATRATSFTRKLLALSSFRPMICCASSRLSIGRSGATPSSRRSRASRRDSGLATCRRCPARQHQPAETQSPAGEFYPREGTTSPSSTAPVPWLLPQRSCLADRQSNFTFHLSVKRALQGTAATLVEGHNHLPMLESTAIVARTGWISWVGVDLGAKMLPVENIRNRCCVESCYWPCCSEPALALIDAKRLLLPISALSERARQIGAGQYDLGLLHLVSARSTSWPPTYKRWHRRSRIANNR